MKKKELLKLQNEEKMILERRKNDLIHSERIKLRNEIIINSIENLKKNM